MVGIVNAVTSTLLSVHTIEHQVSDIRQKQYFLKAGILLDCRSEDERNGSAKANRSGVFSYRLH